MKHARSCECSSAVIELVVGHNFHVKRGQGYFIRSAWDRGERTRRKEIDAVRRGAGLIAQPKTMRFYDTACNIARRIQEFHRLKNCTIYI